MDRCAIVLVFLGPIAWIGCGSESPVAPVGTEQIVSVADTSTPTASTNPTPSDVVSQFLDEVRRGGEDSRANELLTQRARTELGRIGQSIQPIGSPDARFVVTRAETVPGNESSALVHSLWSEPSGGEIQVVWAVQQEPAGWRISGLAMELDPSQSPVVMDFENAEMMAKLLAAPDPEAGKSAPAASAQPETAETQASAPNSTISR